MTSKSIRILWTKLDTLTVGQAKSHVVIEHSVHVLDPNSIDGTIKNSPHLLIGLVLRSHSHDLGGKTISPLLRNEVDLTIKLTHRDSLRVKDLLVDELEASIGVILFAESCHHISQHLIASGFTATGGSDQHDTETHVESLIQVNYLLHESGLRLETKL